MPLEPQHGMYVSTAELCELSGAHRTTAERWQRSRRLPRAVALLVRLVRDGELELVSAAWRGYRLDRRTGTLWTPDNWPCRPGDIEAIRYRLAHVRALERELARTRSALAVALAERRRPRKFTRTLELVDDLAHVLRALRGRARNALDAMALPPLPARRAPLRDQTTDRRHERGERADELGRELHN